VERQTAVHRRGGSGAYPILCGSPPT
jgi:hypothetical protein